MVEQPWSWGWFKRLGMYEYMWYKRFGLYETMEIKRLKIGNDE